MEDSWSTMGVDILNIPMQPEGLLNGNIAAMLTNNGAGLLGMAYQYDALHRIKQAQAYNWSSSWSASSDYGMFAEYDPNGNIMSLFREGPSGTEDEFGYDYYDAPPNQLRHVAGTSTLSGLPSQSGDNYVYDAIGNLIEDVSFGTEMTWDVYGKLRTVDGGYTGNVIYLYDAQGNRLVRDPGGEFPTDIYVRDASGNVIAVYEKELVFGSGEIVERLSELNLYGSSRLGLLKTYRKIYSSTAQPLDQLTTASTRQQKSYELSNHPSTSSGQAWAISFIACHSTQCDGRTTISDKKTGEDSNLDGDAEKYLSDVISKADYYPFGLAAPAEALCEGGRCPGGRCHPEAIDLDSMHCPPKLQRRRGKEKDDAISSLTNYDYGFRIYNSGIARFLSVDPLTASYPWYTPYQFAGNMPIAAIDVDGLEPAHAGKENQEDRAPDQRTGIVDDWTHLGPGIGWTANSGTGPEAVITALRSDSYAAQDNTASTAIDQFGVVQASRSDDPDRYWKVNSFYVRSKDIYAAVSGTNSPLASSLLRGEYGIDQAQRFFEYEIKQSITRVNSYFEPLILSVVPFSLANTGVGLRYSSYAARNPLVFAAKTGANLVDDVAIQFGKGQNQVYHAFRHTDALGLDRLLVQSSIQTHFKTVSSQVVAGKPFNQIIEIGGQRIQYTAFRLSDGTFNIGRIHGVK